MLSGYRPGWRGDFLYPPCRRRTPEPKGFIDDKFIVLARLQAAGSSHSANARDTTRFTGRLPQGGRRCCAGVGKGERFRSRQRGPFAHPAADRNPGRTISLFVPAVHGLRRLSAWVSACRTVWLALAVLPSLPVPRCRSRGPRAQPKVATLTGASLARR
jgi:hypothetical protein